MPRLCSLLLSVLLVASSAAAVEMAWTFVGDLGNACEIQPDDGTIPGGCFGAVDYAYSIGTYEVSNAQYAEFLNAKAVSDFLGLYHTGMGTGVGGITRTGTQSHYNYAAVAGRENQPVNFVSFFDALRFANWMNNGQGSGDTETGAYTLLDNRVTPINWQTVTRNEGATVVLATEDEWYKAAYYDASSSSYFGYPARSDTETTCAFPPLTNSNTANCDDGNGYGLANVGSYTGSAGPYGTFDQGGNLGEWNETFLVPEERVTRGGSYVGGPIGLAAWNRNGADSRASSGLVGFR